MKQHLTHPLSAAVMVLLMHATVSAQSEYQEFFSAPSGDTLSRFEFYKTPEGGGYIWQTGSASGWDERMFIRVDEAGVPQWSKSVHYVGNPTYTFDGMRSATPDHGMLVWSYGHTEMVFPDSFAVVRMGVKQNASGQVEWARRYVGPIMHDHEGEDFVNVMTVLPDGSSVIASFWDNEPYPGSELDVMKVDSDGIVQWSLSEDLLSPPYEPSASIAAQPDGSILIAFDHITASNESVDLVKISPGGQMLWHKQHVLNNASWEVTVANVAVHPSGKFFVNGSLYSTSLQHSFIMWFTPDGELYRHRLSDGNYGGDTWSDAGIWSKGSIGGWESYLMDSTGSSVLQGVELTSPGLIGNILHQLIPKRELVGPDTIWMSGVYRTTDQIFGYVEEKPFLIRTAIDPLNLCRLEPLAGYPINYIDVPGSLLVITTDSQFTVGNVSFSDTAMVVIDHPLPTTYDFCTLVGVEDSQAATDNISLWPDPLEQGTLLNVQATAPSDLAIFDTRGRAVLQANDQRLSRQVSTAGLAPGTYWATGNDQRGARLWSRAFVVL